MTLEIIVSLVVAFMLGMGIGATVYMKISDSIEEETFNKEMEERARRIK